MQFPTTFSMQIRLRISFRLILSSAFFSISITRSIQTNVVLWSIDVFCYQICNSHVQISLPCYCNYTHLRVPTWLLSSLRHGHFPYPNHQFHYSSIKHAFTNYSIFSTQMFLSNQQVSHLIFTSICCTKLLNHALIHARGINPARNLYSIFPMIRIEFLTNSLFEVVKYWMKSRQISEFRWIPETEISVTRLKSV